MCALEFEDFFLISSQFSCSTEKFPNNSNSTTQLTDEIHNEAVAECESIATTTTVSDQHENSIIDNTSLLNETSKVRPDGLLAKLALPCQQNAEPFDYGQCYSYYANGCFNTCQFVNLGDIEDFMNNEKRKEKSRDAARSRRSRETQIFTDLGNALPLATEQIAHLDKASVMRLAISFLRVRDMIKLVPILPLKDKLTQRIKMESFFLKALEGFLLAISLEGDFVYTSENVNEYLGIPQIDLMGQNVFEYSHPCDHDEIRDILAEKTRDQSNTSKSFFIRLKCTLTSKGRSVNLKSATYKVIHCTGHIIKDKEDKKKEANGSLLSCFVAIGQPIPHPSNIDTPLPRQTFLTKHSLDMKFTDADDEFMTDTLGYTPEDLIGKSVYDYHHAMDGESIGSAFKCLFSKGQCETGRYRFLAKTGGFVWVVTQASLIHDKNQKPHSVVCVNYVISGVECKDEIYAAHQLASVQTEAATAAVTVTERIKQLPPPQSPPLEVLSVKSPTKTAVIPKKTINIPEIRVECESVDDENEKKLLIEKSDVKKLQISTRPLISSRPKPVSVTAKLLSSYEPPATQDPEFIIFKSGADQSRTAADQLKSDDMNKGYLSFSDDDSSFTMLKDEQEDLTHLAPVAGDVCVPLDFQPYIDNMLFDDILLKDDLGPLLNEKPTDPFISYRNLRDSSPQLSPNLSKSSDCSLTSLSSPNSSLLEEDQMSTFMNFQIDDDLGMKTSYLPMSFTDDLSIITNDYMWNQNEKNKNQDDNNGIPESNSTLAQMLSSSVNKHTLKSSDRGGGTMDESNSLDGFNEKNSEKNWSTTTKLDTDKIINDDHLHNNNNNNQKVNRSPSVKRSNLSNNYAQQSKRSKNEPKTEKMSPELLQQLMTNNHQRGRPPKNKNNWLLNSGNKAACISQPSDSVLMNLLSEEKQLAEQLQKNIKLQKNILTRKKVIQQLQRERYRQKQEENKRKSFRKSSLSLLDPEALDMPSFMDLTQQDCEVNAPVDSSLLQGEELLIALDVAKNI